MIKLFELFAGYGSQSLALKRLDIEFENVGYCEIDKYAIQAHKALHGEDISNFGDITKVDADSLPDMDLLTYSFPCQDISVAGKGRGLSKDSGTRSSLLWECHKIIAAKRPKYLMMENVKNLVGKKNKSDFESWLQELEELGYNNYYKVINAKDCGIPQNRERVFCISIRRDADEGTFRFNEPFDSGIRLKDMLEDEVDEKFYISDEKCEKLINQIKQTGKANTNPSGKGMNGNVHIGEIAPTLTTNKGEGPKMVVPCITPDRLEKRQNGRRFKEDGEPMFTLTSQDRHGVLVNELQLHKNLSGGKWDKIHQSSRRVYKDTGIAPTVPTCQGGNIEPKVYTNYRIRKLTPKECFRLMGLTDEEIKKIQDAGISNSQQYKLAGNSIVVDQMFFLKNLLTCEFKEDEKQIKFA